MGTKKEFYSTKKNDSRSSVNNDVLDWKKRQIDRWISGTNDK